MKNVNFLAENDKAIEYTALLKEARRMVRSLEKINVLASECVVMLDEIEASTKSELEQYRMSDVFSGEYTEALIKLNTGSIYEKGIGKINKVISFIEQTYGLYFKVDGSIKVLDKTLKDGNITKEQADQFGFMIVDLLTKVHFSNTIYYGNEQKVVESLYNLAYKIIKAELLTLGKSKVLDWVKINPVAGSFISDLVEEEIQSLGKVAEVNPTIQMFLGMMQQNGAIGSYLDEGLILFLAVHGDKTSILDIERQLKEIYESYVANNKEEETYEKEKCEKEKYILKNKEKLKAIGKDMKREIACFLISAVVVLGAHKGISKISEKVGAIGLEYKTECDITSTYKITQTRDLPEYMEALDGFSKRVVYQYTPWEKDFRQGSYNRDVYELDVSDRHMGADEAIKYAEENPQEMVWVGGQSISPSGFNEFNDVYEKAIYEFVHIMQDENDVKDGYWLMYGACWFIFVVLMVVFGCEKEIEGIPLVELYVGYYADFAKNFPKWIKIFRENRKYQEEMLILLECFKQLGEENEEKREEFLRIYHMYQDVIIDEKVKRMYRKLEKNEGK